jgi:hypothetical protein
LVSEPGPVMLHVTPLPDGSLEAVAVIPTLCPSSTAWAVAGARVMPIGCDPAGPQPLNAIPRARIPATTRTGYTFVMTVLSSVFVRRVANL